MADDPTPVVAPGGGGTSASRPANVNLTPQEVQALLAKLGYPNGTIVGNVAVSQPKMGTGLGGATVPIDIGEYQISVQDPSRPGAAIPVTITKGTDANGNATWDPSDLPKTSPTNVDKPSDLVVKITGKGAYYPNDPNNLNGGYHLIVPENAPNQDEEIKKAVDRQVAEGERNARQRNEATTGIYGTDAEVATIQHQAAADKLGQDQLAQRITEFNRTQKAADAKQATDDRVANQNILQSQAQVGLIGAQTGSAQATTEGTKATTAATTQTTEQQAKLFPTVEAQAKATLAGTEEANKTAAQSRTIAGQPTLQGTVGGTPVITQRNPLTGEVTQNQMDLAYQPKTQAEIAARVGQINSLMTQKSQQVQSKVGQMVNGKQFTADDALQEFNTWYGQQVAPQTDALKAAQDEAAFARGKDLATMRTSAATAANAAGTQTTNAFNALVAAKPMGDPAAIQAAAKDIAAGRVPSNMDQLGWKGPNPIALQQQAIAAAQKYLTPDNLGTGAAPVNIDALTRNPYTAPGVTVAQPMPFTGGATPTPQPMPNTGGQTPAMQNMAAPATAQAPAQPAATPGGMPQEFWDKLFGRIRSDQAEQQVQASAMPQQRPPGMYDPGFQARNPSAVGQPATGPVAGDTSPALPPQMQPQPNESIEAWRSRVMGGLSSFASPQPTLQYA
jgi:hypothetical protein